MTKQYAISLYRRKRADGVWVQLGWRVSIRRRGYIVNRNFSSKEFGGMDAALQAAIAFRDEINRGCVPLSKREVCATIRVTNTSGVPGVIRTSDRGQDYWKARLLTAEGRESTKQFSIKKYGERAAFNLAVQARSQLLEMVTGFHVHHPDIKGGALAFAIAEPELIRRPCKVKPDEHPYAMRRECNVRGVGVTNVKTTNSDGTFYSTRYWTSTIRDAHESRKKRYFSVAKYGEEEAKRLAIDHQRRSSGATPIAENTV